MHSERNPTLEDKETHARQVLSIGLEESEPPEQHIMSLLNENMCKVLVLKKKKGKPCLCCGLGP
jgi:hypothetical protein